MFNSRNVLGAALLALTLAQPAHAKEAFTAAPVQAGVQDRALAYGLYELLYNKPGGQLWVASAEARTGTEGGALYRLDPTTLETLGVTHTDSRNFGLTQNADGSRLFVTNSFEARITQIDAATGKVLGRLVFDDKSFDGTPYGPRQVLFDEQRRQLYVGGVGDPGLIWVVDAADLSLKGKITQAGKWVTGLKLSGDGKILYAANGDGEILRIDPDRREILSRWRFGGQEPALLLNILLDEPRDQLLVTDHSKMKTVLVVDLRSGKLKRTLDVGDALAIVRNPHRPEIYVSHREQGKVSVLSADSFKVLRQYAAEPMANSLALDPTGRYLYVSVKAAPKADYMASEAERVLRIDLDAAPAS